MEDRPKPTKHRVLSQCWSLHPHERWLIFPPIPKSQDFRAIPLVPHDRARVVDAFAGSGALGIEALSRGAEHCTFIERDREALEVLRENLETLGLVEKSTIVRGDVLTNVALVRNASLVLADPPYEFKQWRQFLSEVACDLVVAESDRDMNLELPAIIGWEVTRVKRYGRAYVSFLQRLA